MKKALPTIKMIFFCVVAVFAVCIMIFTIVASATFDRTDREIFGCHALVAQSNSDFNSGDLVLVKEADPSVLRVGDIIAYQSAGGQIMIHTVRELTMDAEGNPGFIVYNTIADTGDEDIISYDSVLGKYQSRLAGIGGFFRFLKTIPGYLLCIFCPFLLLIVMLGLHCVQLYQKSQQKPAPVRRQAAAKRPGIPAEKHDEHGNEEMELELAQVLAEIEAAIEDGSELDEALDLEPGTGGENSEDAV